MKIDPHLEAIKFMQIENLSAAVFPLAIVEKAITHGVMIMVKNATNKIREAANELERQRNKNITKGE